MDHCSGANLSHQSQCLEEPSVETEQVTLRPEATLAHEFPVHKEMFGQATAVAPPLPATVAERHNFSEPIPQFVLIDGSPLLLYFSQQRGARSIGGLSSMSPSCSAKDFSAHLRASLQRRRQ